MNSRERVECAFAHREADRVPTRDAFWPSTLEIWRREGLPEDQTPEEYFDLDIVTLSLDCTLQLEEEIIEETEDFIIKWNANGGLIKDWKHATSVPQTFEYRIKDRQDWEEYKPNLTMNYGRLDWEKAESICRKARERSKYLMLNVGTGFGEVHRLVGIEELLIAMADDPDWVDDMFAAFANLVIDAVDEIRGQGLEFDALFIRNDMGYKNGPLFSPRMYAELLLPHDKRVCSLLTSRGIPAILHCDGNITRLLALIIEAGFSGLHPLEVKAGMDLIQLKKEYGDKLVFFGGIDARKMGMPDASNIEREIKEKLSCAMKGGGYIFHSDHSVPDDVSLQRYRKILELVALYGMY